MLVASVAFIIIVPVNALIETIASISVSPKTVGLGQYVVINGWITPQPVYSGPPDVPGKSVYAGVYVDLKKPSGNTVTLGPFTTYS